MHVRGSAVEVWHETVAIPGRSDMREALLVSPTALPAGAQLSFIVTGRGANAWSLGELSVRKPE
ncbi:MAG TPA: hypothetical protein VFS00_09335 [Polyangiaceae bacterium]|nr:hypothetical protein [Polyangiaceae bacterium]